MTDQGTQQEWRGLLRRFHKPWGIPNVQESSAENYILCFVDTYMGAHVDSTALPQCISKFVKAWGVRDVARPQDSLAKYCQSRLRDAHANGFVGVGSDGVRVLPQKEADFVRMLFDDDALRDWPRGYAGGGVDEPACKRQRLVGVECMRNPP